MQRALAKLIDLISHFATAKQAAKQLQSEFSLPAKILTSAVVDGGQIGTIIAVNRALGAQVPTRIGTQTIQTNKDSSGRPIFATVQFKPGEIDFNNDIPDDIQIGISLQYPYISTAFAIRFVAKVVSQRSKGTGVDDVTVRAWHMELKTANEEGMWIYRDAEDALKPNPTHN
jgi:hypothetical protein